jgi:oxygen-dependent protoporphyrinogen oxidase
VVTEESVAQFVKRRFGQEVLDYAVEPFVGGNHAGDVNNLSMVSTFPQLVQMEERYGSLVLGSMIRRFKGSKIGSVAHLFSFQEGMEVLPKAIVKYLGSRFSPGVQVTGIEPQGQAWTVTGTTGSQTGVAGKEQRWTADAVVVTAPAFASARILGPLSGVLQGLLAGVDYAPVGVVYLGFSKNQITHRMDGLGYLAPRREDGFVLGSLWNSVLFPNRAPSGKVALTNYVGGMRWPGTLDLSDNTLLEKTLQDLRRLLGIYGEPEFVKILRHPKAIPQYTLGHTQRLQGINESLQKFPGLFISGNYLSGVSMRDCISLGVKVSGNVREYLQH